MEYILKTKYRNIEWETKPSDNVTNLIYTAFELGRLGTHEFKITIVDKEEELGGDYG